MNFLKSRSKKSLVKTISMLSDENDDRKSDIAGQSESNNLHQPDNMSFDNITELRNSLEKAQTEIQRLQTENEKIEEARSIAEDRANYFENLLKERESEILSLSSSVEILTLRNNELEMDNLDKIHEGKTKYMTDLEQELKILKDESTKQVTNLQRRIKKLKEQQSKSKQEYALETFALKDEKNTLLEENQKLQDCLQTPNNLEPVPRSYLNKGQGRDFTQWGETENGKQGHSNLVVQLSQQVSILDGENQRLKTELEKTNVLLNKLPLRTQRPSRRKQEQLVVNMASLDLERKSKVELVG